MGQDIQLSAGNGHRLDAYLSSPTGTPRGGMLVIQEIFGVTHHHIRAGAKLALERSLQFLHRFVGSDVPQA